MTTLIGTNPDQIPVNSMLGGMAYQDPDSISVKDLNSSGTANIASLVSPAVSITDLSYSGTLTGGTGVINIGSNQIYKDASGNVSLGGTGALKMNEGTTAQRPASPQEGMIRKNSTLGVIEGYSAAGWVQLQGSFIQRTAFTTVGSHTWTPHPSTRCFVYEVVSGGGAGGASSTCSGSQHSVGTPGQHGRCVRGFIPRTVNLSGLSYSVQVGAGGIGGFSHGPDGGQSFLQNGVNQVVVNGGEGGGAGAAESNTLTLVKQTNLVNAPSYGLGGHFVGTVWESPPDVGFGVIVTPDDLYLWVGITSNNPNDFGHGGTSGGSYPSDPAAEGGNGASGAVIIYEYS